MVKEGKKRKLVINGAKLEDAGKITAKTNADETSCDLGVAINNGFVKGMREFKQCVEREEIIFNVQVKPPKQSNQITFTSKCDFNATKASDPKSLSIILRFIHSVHVSVDMCRQYACKLHIGNTLEHS